MERGIPKLSIAVSQREESFVPVFGGPNPPLRHLGPEPAKRHFGTSEPVDDSVSDTNDFLLDSLWSRVQRRISPAI